MRRYAPYNLRQTIFRSKPNDFSIYWERFSDMPISALRALPCRTPDKKETWVFSGEYSPLLHLPQTVFHPKRFASFRPLLYQRFKVNFLPLHPSPGFHWEMIHSIQIPIYKCKPPGNQRGYGEGLDKGFFTSYICGQKTAPKHSYYGFQKDCT